ncbi:MAG: hypothetical protein QG635_367 [Bacteroidota bacterium]|nr:hypothetical protein [Bacteroidota bacterium]
MPVLLNERGDTIHYTYPPPDSTYKHDELIVKFRKSGIKLQKLCYDYDYYEEGKTEKGARPLGIYLSDSTISALMAQRFPIDSLVWNPFFANAIKSYGGKYFRRMTWANPCVDTLSLTRLGDTIRCDDFLWLVLEFETDTNMLDAALLFTMFFQNDIIGAELNYYFEAFSTPNDANFLIQRSLNSSHIGIETAWTYEKGSSNIKVAVIDEGVDYKHCDLGGAKGPGYKIGGGWNFTENDAEFNTHAVHGTKVAGIIGAITNFNCPTANEGIAGIAGGWDAYNIGPIIYGYRIKTATNSLMYDCDKASGAIREATSLSPNSPYGKGVHVINCSWGYGNYNENLRAALFYAYQNGVSVVAASGNSGSDIEAYPAQFDNNIITDVGGAEYNKNRWSGSNYEKHIDIIAPGNEGYDQSSNPYIFTTIVDDSYYPNNDYSYGVFGRTSAAAAHVSGVEALLRSYALRNNWLLLPEDYEGMLKASAEDRNPGNSGGLYVDDFDEETGWGHLQADRIFEMFNDGYNITHIDTIPTLDSTSWSASSSTYYFNENINFTSGTVTSSTYTSDVYFVNSRTLIGIIDISAYGDWYHDNNDKIYIWGNKGFSGRGGYSLANPNYQIPYTEVISGEGGNGIVLDIIYNLNYPLVEVRTYQYDVRDKLGNNLGHWPPDFLLGFNISIFGKKIPVGIKEVNNGIDIVKLYPNPFNLQLNTLITVKPSVKVIIEIFDLQGRRVHYKEMNDTQAYLIEQSLDTSGLPVGVYLTKVTINNSQYFYKLIKRK